MQSTKAKMTCTAVTPFQGADGATVNLECHYDEKNSPEDNSFSKYTPSGNASFAITNPDVIPMFEQGAKYYVVITKIEENNDTADQSANEEIAGN